jgi:hypothetical protein
VKLLEVITWCGGIKRLKKAVALCITKEKAKESINGGFVRDGIQWRKKGIQFPYKRW